MREVYINAPGDVRLRDAEMPVRKSGEALLKVLYCGICGSDLGSYRGTFAYFDYPRIPGHEISAEIIDIDEPNEYGLKKGMIVTCNPYFNCTKCYSCRRGLVNTCQDNHTMGCQMDGALRNYITMPIERLYDGKGIDPKLLTLIEPFCIGYHGAVRANIKKGDKVLVVGSGTIGTFAAISAKLAGAKVYMADISAEKLNNVVQTYNMDGAILNDSPENFMKQVNEITNGDGFDVCLEVVGLPSTFQNCIDAAAFGGNIGVIGVGKKNLDFNFTMIQKKELNIYGSRNALKADFINLIEELKDNKIDVSSMISAIYPIEQSAEAFKAFSDNQGSMLKVIIQC